VSDWDALVVRGGHQIAVGDSTMRCVDTGAVRGRDDDPPPVLVFLHGNPTSSFLWRNVIPALADRFRCVAVDLIGMGGSGKPDIAYTWADHRAYLGEALDALETDGADVRLVMHDWGVALGLDYAREHADRVAGVALVEGHLRPLESWQDFDAAGRSLFRELRDPVLGRRKIEDENFFLTDVLPGGMHHQLTDDERRAYEAPFPTPGSRRPIWAWVTQIPIAGHPPEVHAALEANLAWLGATTIPRLLLHGEPGAIIDTVYAARIAAECEGLVTASVGPGLHFLPEDQPEAIVARLVEWLQD
jgi:haloalkane dehalogenase